MASLPDNQTMTFGSHGRPRCDIRRAAVGAWIRVFQPLVMLLVFALPAVAQDQAGFTYTTNNGTITINRYQGPGGAVAIPASINGLPVTSIGDSAFAWSGLNHITLPESLTSIGREAFRGCGLTGITIPGSVTRIEDWTFANCSSLTNITIHSGIASIGLGAFTSCPSLAGITVDALNSFYSSVDGVLFNKSQSTLIQYPGGKAGSYSVPAGVANIGRWAFRDCATLTSVALPGSLNSIGANAFEVCWRLRAVYFQVDAPAIDARAFESTHATLFYLPGSASWEETLAGRPAFQWTGIFGVQAIQVHAGLSVAGESGKVYSIEYTTVQSEPAENDWWCLEFVQLPARSYQWIDKSAPTREKRFYRAVEMEAPTNMVFIPPGTFLMGSPPDEVGRDENEGPQTRVIISRGFWMGVYEVTLGEYLDVMGNPPFWMWGPPANVTELNHPVDLVEYHEALAYCAALTERERLAGRIPPDSAYRLPTEAEWEYACRAGTSTRFSHGDDPGYTNLTNYAWSDGVTHPVGQKLPNPWGLHDMHGNVGEMCLGLHGSDPYWIDLDPYPGGIVIDPQGRETGVVVVRRGLFRSAYRYYVAMGEGFRAVLAPVNP